MRREPENDIGVVLRPAPLADASDEDKLNWIMECGCEFGRMVSHFARQIDANDKHIAAIMHYMTGRALGAYVSKDDKPGLETCADFYELGMEHGRRANDDMEARANAEGTETRQ